MRTIRFTPPDYIIVFIFLELILNYFFPIKQIIMLPYNYIGILLILLGLLFNYSVFLQFKKIKTTIKPYEMPTKMVSSGLFRISRNPLYLGMFLILLGESILLGSLISFVLPVSFLILVNIFSIPIEEKNLERKFGKRYLEYKKEVRRWF